MIFPTEEDVGRKVVYRCKANGYRAEEGFIKSMAMDSKFVFVNFHEGDTAASTPRRALRWGDLLKPEAAAREILKVLGVKPTAGNVDGIEMVMRRASIIDREHPMYLVDLTGGKEKVKRI